MKLPFSLLAACAVAACHVPAEAATALTNYLTFSGFGTLGYVRDDVAGADYRREFEPKGAGEDGSLLVDSNLGLQLTATANDWLSATVQTLTVQRAIPQLTTRVDWAYVKAAPLDGLAVRAGKMDIPNFLISDSRRIGYANTALRPPNEVYGLDLLNGGLLGADVSYRIPIAGNGLVVTALGGTSSLSEPGQAFTHFSGVRGLNAVWDGDWYSLRLGHIEAKTVPPNYDHLVHYAFTGLGATVDRAGVVLQAEAVSRRATMAGSFVDANGWYVLGGYRFGNLLPYAEVAQMKPRESRVSPQKTTALGLRWDAFKSADVKFQVERIDTDGTSGSSFLTPDVETPFGPAPTAVTRPVTTMSVALDFVF